MMNREVSYQRNIAGSYMKIPVSRINEFDERLILKKKLPGLIPVERCFMDGRGEYWYQITGKQSLDTYCRLQDVSVAFIEQVILSVCSEIEILEWNLLDINCLQLEPELVYISNQTQEVLFCVYPENTQDISLGFQQLMEYLLTRIDHKDEEMVRLGYGIYEKTLREGYNILDIREFIVQRRNERNPQIQDNSEIGGLGKATEGRRKSDKVAKQDRIRNVDRTNSVERTNYTERSSNEARTGSFERWISREKVSKADRTGKQEEKGVLKKQVDETCPVSETGVRDWRNELGKTQEIWAAMQETWGRIRELFKTPLIPERIKKKELSQADFFYDTEEEEELEPVIEIHPTVCIGQGNLREEGLLLYEGRDTYPDYHIQKEVCTVGKDQASDLLLQKETVSRHHAKIRKMEDGYYIEDLNSTNGTYLNDELLSYKEPRLLHSSDLICFADVKYRFI